MLRRFYRQRGINMIEVMATIIITSIGLLGLNSLQLKANRSTLDAGNKSQAVWILDDLTNRMRANATEINEYDTGGEMTCTNTAKPKICSAYHSGGNRISAPLNCTIAEQAKSDLYEVLCGYDGTVNGSEVTFSSAANFVANPGLNVVVDSDNNAEITLSWDVRTSAKDASGNTVYALRDNTTGAANLTLRDSVTTRVHP